MASDSDLLGASDLIDQSVNDEEVRKERRGIEWADAARFTHWVGIVLIGAFLVTLLNATPPKFADLTWQLGVITLLISGGTGALLGALLICLGRIFNLGDRQIQKRALLVRTLASWVAIGWLLLIPLQVWVGVRLINNQAGEEVRQIETLQRVARAIRNAANEDQLRAAMGQIPNQPPLPRLTVPLEVAKANLLGQMQPRINAAKNKQEEFSSQRWQTWMKELLRNGLQCALLGLGFLAIGKNRLLEPATAKSSSPPPRRSRSRSKS